MSLTTGRGPLSPNPAGRFSAPIPAGVVYVEPFQRRVRGVRGRNTVIDSERVLLVHRPGQPPRYAFPVDDVGDITSTPDPDADGYLSVRWDAVDAWYEEDEHVLGHTRNPYHRVDCMRTSRRLRVEVAGTVLVDTTDTVGVYETALAPKLYVDPASLRRGLRRNDTTTYCPYKGTATWWDTVIGDITVADAAWSYEDPYPESEPIRGLLSFEPQHVTVQADLPS